jgi:hypothetical protein
MTTTTPTPALSGANKTGLAIAFLLGVGDVAFPFIPPPPGARTGPPFPILLLGAALGLIVMVAAVVAWRTGRRAAVRLASGARILSMILALPAFFVGVPAWVKAEVGVEVLLTAVAIVLMLAPARRPAPVTD